MARGERAGWPERPIAKATYAKRFGAFGQPDLPKKNSANSGFDAICLRSPDGCDD